MVHTLPKYRTGALVPSQVGRLQAGNAGGQTGCEILLSLCLVVVGIFKHVYCVCVTGNPLRSCTNYRQADSLVLRWISHTTLIGRAPPANKNTVLGWLLVRWCCGLADGMGAWHALKRCGEQASCRGNAACLHLVNCRCRCRSLGVFCCARFGAPLSPSPLVSSRRQARSLPLSAPARFEAC